MRAVGSCGFVRSPTRHEFPSGMSSPEDVRAEILRRLSAAESDHGVRILYACESGSRAWNFASPDSDYDVRFLYVHDRDWYLSFDVDRHRDVIEYPILDGIDCNGWDLRKALHLFLRSNGALLEWLHSPIIYLERGPLARRLRDLASRVADAKALCFHYNHMARRNARVYLQGEQVRLKKYFYVLRPLLAIRFLEARGGLPPVDFEALVAAASPPAVRDAITSLLALKRESTELGQGPAIPVLTAFINAELARQESLYAGVERPEPVSRDDLREALNDCFRSAVLFPDEG